MTIIKRDPIVKYSPMLVIEILKVSKMCKLKISIILNWSKGLIISWNKFITLVLILNGYFLLI